MRSVFRWYVYLSDPKSSLLTPWKTGSSAIRVSQTPAGINVNTTKWRRGL